MGRTTAAVFLLTTAATLAAGVPAASAAAAGDHLAMPQHQSSQCEGKQEWPELLGTDAREASETVEAENPDVTARVLRENTPTTADFRCDRVRIYTDGSNYGTGDGTNTVSRVPRVG